MHKLIKQRIAFGLVITVAIGFATGSASQQHAIHQHHDAHDHNLMERGAQRMGFNQQTTTHHFVLLPSGGLVRVQANLADDATGIAQIRTHLQEIRRKFSEGDFDAPEFIHAQEPPGVPVMRQRRAEIRYSYRAIERGGELRISAKNAGTIAAIQDFLKFQITDHKTGDPLQVRR